VTAGDERLERARSLYESAVFGGEREAPELAEVELDGVEADLALARGRILHARFLADRCRDDAELALFERAAELYNRLGDRRGEAEALFWTGTFHQVVDGDTTAGGPFFERAAALAQAVGDRLTMSYLERHLGFVAAEEGRLDEARRLLEESIRLRREIEFQPGVAAGLLALAELELDAGNRQRAEELLAEARRVAEESEAAGILRWIEEAEGHL
jgi:tetratricopeptide (TPR) repeat protein